MPRFRGANGGHRAWGLEPRHGDNHTAREPRSTHICIQCTWASPLTGTPRAGAVSCEKAGTYHPVSIYTIRSNRLVAVRRSSCAGMRARELCCGAEGARLSIEVLTLTEPRRTTAVLPRTSDADEKQPSFALKYCARGHLSPNAAARAVVGSIDRSMILCGYYEYPRQSWASAKAVWPRYACSESFTAALNSVPHGRVGGRLRCMCSAQGKALAEMGSLR